VRAKQVQGEVPLALPGAKAHVQTRQVFCYSEDLRIGAGPIAKIDNAACKFAPKL